MSFDGRRIDAEWLDEDEDSAPRLRAAAARMNERRIEWTEDEMTGQDEGGEGEGRGQDVVQQLRWLENLVRLAGGPVAMNPSVGAVLRRAVFEIEMLRGQRAELLWFAEADARLGATVQPDDHDGDAAKAMACPDCQWYEASARMLERIEAGEFGEYHRGLAPPGRFLDEGDGE